MHYENIEFLTKKVYQHRNNPNVQIVFYGCYFYFVFYNYNILILYIRDYYIGIRIHFYLNLLRDGYLTPEHVVQFEHEF